MSLPTVVRLRVLLCFVLVTFAGALFILERSQREQVDLLFRERVDETTVVFARLLKLKSDGFAVHAYDYSRWDEFVEFIGKPDSTWAKENLEDSIGEFGVDIAWVLDAQLRTVYIAHGDEGRTITGLPVPLEKLRAQLARQPFLHGFERTPQGVLELWTAPIQPGMDTARKTAPVGYYVIGRLWTPAVQENLAELAVGKVELLEGAAAGRSTTSLPSSGLIEVQQAFVNLDSVSVASLRFTAVYRIAQRVESLARQTLWFMGIVSAIVFLIAYLFVIQWVTVPLKRIQSALHAKDPKLLGSMPEGHDEFGRLSALMVEFFAQREVLEQEVRERRRAEAESAQQKDFVRDVLETDPNLIYVVDDQRHLILANQAAIRLFGAPAQTLLGCHIEDILAPLGCADSYRINSSLALAHSAPHTSVESVTMPDGSVRRYQSIHCPHRPELGGAQVLTISEDVTDRLRHQQELLEAKEAAEAGTRAKSQFLANISHELRTPMHGILSFARFGLREATTAERSELLDYFENIHSCGAGLLELLNDLLDLSRMEAGRMTFDMTSVDLGDTVEQAVGEFESLISERGIRLTVTTAPDMPPVRGDRTKMLQVLRNLLSNAAKFTPAEHGIEVVTDFNETYVRVAVNDEGVGIPAAELGSIFDMFVQSSTNTPTAGGTGLGLAISREIVNAHGGRIWAENRAEGGSRMRFEIPRADAVALPTAEAEVSDTIAAAERSAA